MADTPNTSNKPQPETTTDTQPTPSQQAGDKVKKTVNKATKPKKSNNVASKIGKTIASAIKTIGVAIWNAIKAAFSLILTTFGPIGVIITILIIIFAVMFLGLTIYFKSESKKIVSGGYNSINQTMTSYAGFSGEAFYGARAIYYDEEQSSKALASSYLSFTVDILEKVNEYGITITLESSGTEYSAIQNATKNFATQLSPTNKTDLLDATKSIDHFGFRESQEKNEKDVVLSSLAKSISEYYVVKDTATGTILENKNGQEDVIAAKKALEGAYEENFGYMKKICSKILIKDYLLNESNSNFTTEKLQYISVIYMPNQKVTINNVDFIYKVDDNETVQSKLIHKTSTNSEILVESSIDSSWYENLTATQSQEYNTTPIELETFSAFNPEEPSLFKDGIAVFELIKNGLFESYFNTIEGEINETNLISSIKLEECLMLQFNATAKFNFIDMTAEYSLVSQSEK